MQKKTIIVVLATVAIGLSLAAVFLRPSPKKGWTFAGSFSGDTWAFDASTLELEGKMRRVWMLKNMNPPDRQGNRSMRGLYEFNCTGKQLRSIQTSLFREVMAEGKSREDDFEPSSWAHVAPDTIGEHLLKQVCDL